MKNGEEKHGWTKRFNRNLVTEKEERMGRKQPWASFNE